MDFQVDLGDAVHEEEANLEELISSKNFRFNKGLASVKDIL